MDADNADPLTKFMAGIVKLVEGDINDKKKFTIGGWDDETKYLQCGDFDELVDIAKFKANSAGMECLPHAAIEVEFYVISSGDETQITEGDDETIVLRVYSGEYSGGMLWDEGDVLIETNPPIPADVMVTIFKGKCGQMPVTKGKMYMLQFLFKH